MKKTLHSVLFLTFISIGALAQNYTTPVIVNNLLDRNSYDQIVGETSGEQAYYHVLDMAGYEKNRTAAEYRNDLHETAYVLAKMKEYGLPGAAVERFAKSSTWDGISGSLWEVSPNTAKIIDYRDLAAALGQGSKNSDVKAEIVWVGRGTVGEIERAGVKGKIVLTESSPGRVHNAAIAQGAVGVVSFSSARPLVDPLQVPNTGIGGPDATFCFNLPPRTGYALRDRLLAGEKITLHAKAQSAIVETDLQVPTCHIPGTDPNAGEIVFSAHLFEGYVKLGANDNTSGSVALLEIARVMNTLINEGRIERPKRTMRFVMGPEFSGIGPWVNAHLDIMDRTLCNLNLDMVGLWLSKSGSYYNLHRTTMGNPHYVNDVAESFFHYMGATNKAFTGTGVGRPEALVPVMSVIGSQEPFYYAINANYGASDHEVFNDWGVQVPGLMMITWPDNYYHTSGDRPEILDPTQLKRAAVLGAAIAYTIAVADEQGAVEIAGEVLGNSLKRMSLLQTRGVAAINAASQADLNEVYKKARFDMDAQAINEKETALSTMELAPQSASLKSYVAANNTLIDNALTNSLKSLENIMKIRCAALDVKFVAVPELTAEEKAASKVFPKATAKVKAGGYGVMRMALSDVSSKYRDVRVGNSAELAKLTTSGTHSILDIKKMLEAQFPQKESLENITSYLNMLKEGGLVTF